MPDQLHYALGAVLSDYHWRMFCDAWLAIGLAATLVYETAGEHGGDAVYTPKLLGQRIGRVRYKKLKRP